MKPSFLRHPVAVLRQICGLTQKEFADKVGISVVYLQKIEATPQQRGGKPLPEVLAKRIFAETGASLSWLLSGDPKARPISAAGEKYTKKVYNRAEADKKKGFFEHPVFRLTNAIGFCAQLVAILESAHARKDYFMGAYKVGKALEKLRNEFGQDLQIYPMTHSPHVVIDPHALELLVELINRGRQELDKSSQRLGQLISQKKQSSSQRQFKKLRTKSPSKKKHRR